MDLESTVEGFLNSAPMEGIPSAWQWSPAPGVNFAGVIDTDRDFLFQFTSRGPYNEAITRSVASFCREHAARLADGDAPLTVVEGFSAPGYSFDVLVSLSPAVHRFYEYEQPELTPHVRAVFPAYACEVAGDETVDEAVARRRMIEPAVFDRKPAPYVRMRFDNLRTKAGTNGPNRIFLEMFTLRNELALLENSPGSFVEFENRHHQVWRVEWDGTWQLRELPNGPTTTLSLDDLLTFTEEQLRR